MSEAMARASRWALVRSSSVMRPSSASRFHLPRSRRQQQVAFAYPGWVELQLARQAHEDAPKVHRRRQLCVAVRLDPLQVRAPDARALGHLLKGESARLANAPQK